ncbi:MAG: hypothetical protein Q7K43_04365 [Candidatus Woesearchaeota archaeon]|nr:hypothetical protein [Candidatus Woesearchaeota archaeon]
MARAEDFIPLAFEEDSRPYLNMLYAMKISRAQKNMSFLGQAKNYMALFIQKESVKQNSAPSFTLAKAPSKGKSRATKGRITGGGLTQVYTMSLEGDKRTPKKQATASQQSVRFWQALSEQLNLSPKKFKKIFALPVGPKETKKLDETIEETFAKTITSLPDGLRAIAKDMTERYGISSLAELAGYSAHLRTGDAHQIKQRATGGHLINQVRKTLELYENIAQKAPRTRAALAALMSRRFKLTEEDVKCIIDFGIQHIEYDAPTLLRTEITDIAYAQKHEIVTLSNQDRIQAEHTCKELPRPRKQSLEKLLNRKTVTRAQHSGLKNYLSSKGFYQTRRQFLERILRTFGTPADLKNAVEYSWKLYSAEKRERAETHKKHKRQRESPEYSLLKEFFTQIDYENYHTEKESLHERVFRLGTISEIKKWIPELMLDWKTQKFLQSLGEEKRNTIATKYRFVINTEHAKGYSLEEKEEFKDQKELEQMLARLETMPAEAIATKGSWVKQEHQKFLKQDVPRIKKALEAGLFSEEYISGTKKDYFSRAKTYSESLVPIEEKETELHTLRLLENLNLDICLINIAGERVFSIDDNCKLNLARLTRQRYLSPEQVLAVQQIVKEARAHFPNLSEDAVGILLNRKQAIADIEKQAWHYKKSRRACELHQGIDSTGLSQPKIGLLKGAVWLPSPLHTNELYERLGLYRPASTVAIGKTLLAQVLTELQNPYAQKALAGRLGDEEELAKFIRKTCNAPEKTYVHENLVKAIELAQIYLTAQKKKTEEFWQSTGTSSEDLKKQMNDARESCYLTKEKDIVQFQKPAKLKISIDKFLDNIADPYADCEGFMPEDVCAVREGITHYAGLRKLDTNKKISWRMVFQDDNTQRRIMTKQENDMGNILGYRFDSTKKIWYKTGSVETAVNDKMKIQKHSANARVLVYQT